MKLLWKLRFILKDYWQQYLLAFICLQIVSALNLLPPWLIGHVVDGIKDKSLTNQELFNYVAGIVVTGVAVYGFRYVWRAKLYGASIELIRKQRSRLFAHFTQLSPEFYQQHTTGDLMAHATNDLNAVEESVGVGIMTLVDSLIAGLTVLFAMVFLVSGKLTLLAMLPFPLLVWVTKRYGVALYSRFGRSQAAFSNLNEETRESITGIRAVKAHQLTDRQTQRFEQLSMEAVEANTSVARVDALFGPSISLFFGLSFVLALVGGAWLISHGQLTVGLLTSFTLYLSQMLGPMLQFGWQFNVFQRGSASWGRLEKLLSRKPKVSNAPDAQQAPDDTSLSINIQSFSYNAASDEKPVLQGISTEIAAGAFIGITGRTGSGKSTLLRLILREFDLPEGSFIQMGNIPLQQLTVESLREKLAWVPQEPMLFSGTIADNIRFSAPDASLEAVEKAAKLAAIDEEIMGFKDGYDTLLGENGINLSGGQKQRLALARALLADAEILLLDDAFSALDMKTEARILKNLMAMKGKKTIILVTQRLPELITADHILVLDRGRIIEQGNHDRLMASDQPEENTTEHWYAKIFRQQARTLLHPLEVKPDTVIKRSDVA
ncbi:ABC transporter ATP-binding protein [Endozoicomonas elysicola]|uniref:Multidrug resistance-like ATP-binding protein MdlA n=1 Tax=Endozoicomonas elysicola TaxID=305900 RepID=A0A081K7P4_9GAMM|nr:ABC transporter transmembrane domain-containing protein [Endozoicomonas elysicola]KEI70170.1 multidrug ABC transporter ATP-binding protein [Endozoicomonas elysicola]